MRSTEKRERKPGWGADSDILGGFSHRDHGGDTEFTEAVRQGGENENEKE
tara:strand:- start:1273 stop:1422 length:150 start_codon:yes stop_codon:yes gene_type:complete